MQAPPDQDNKPIKGMMSAIILSVIIWAAILLSVYWFVSFTFAI